jgi:Secretion system C-terminal sorting domain
MDIKTFAIGDGDSTNIYGTLAGEKFAAGNPTNINHGIILSDSLIAGDTFDNYGLIDIDYFVTGGPTFINHSSAAIVVTGQSTFSTTATNEVNATMVLGDLVTEGTLTNNGDISVTNWTHGSGIANGTGGRYCISDCFINVDEISGTVDVCDATPGGFCDNDFGTIAGTVTFCAVGSCTNNVGIDEALDKPEIYPNPTSDFVQVNNLIAGSTYQLIDAKGNLIYSGIILSETTVLNLANVETGVYFLKVQTADQSTVSKIIRN